MGKLFGYHTLGVLLKSLSDSCFRADEQEKRGEKVTACGMSSDEIEDLCENYLPYALNPMMTAGQVKKEAHISESTLRRAIADGELESVGNAGDHSHFSKNGMLESLSRKD